MPSFYVYQYVRSKSSKHGEAGTPYYIGKGKGKRAWSGGKDRVTNRPLSRERIVILSVHDSEAVAFSEESRLILLHGRIDLGNGCLRNRTNGGEGNSGRVFSEESRLKMSMAAKGKIISVESRRKMSVTRTGRKLSEEWRRNISKGKKDNANHKGHAHSQETKEKISQSLMGHPAHFTQQHREKISQGNIRRWQRVRQNKGLVSQ